MELYEEIVRSSIVISEIDAAQIVEQKCYRALCDIQAIIRDDRLDDADCFQKIEQIVSVFEALGSNGGNRHDFG